jgi:lysylphosphatidylglycerol synthetase-like protein (DUF2156 family)
MILSVVEPVTSAANFTDVIDHPSGFLALSARNRRFTVRGIPGFIAYRDQRNHRVSLGGVHAPKSYRSLLLDHFLAKAKRRRRRVICVQLRHDQIDLFRDRGFTVNQFGTTYGLRLAGFSLAGGRRMKTRQKVKQARAVGLRVLEVGRELPASESTFSVLSDISARWLAGKRKKELEFMTGELGRPDECERRIFVVSDSLARLWGFITYVPVWGSRPGMLHDLSRRLPDAPVGTMELANFTAIERFMTEGIEYLHFGFTPFAVDGDESTGASPWLAWFARLLWRHGQAIYPAQSQAGYKLKWGPDYIEREFIAFRPLSLLAILDLLTLTRSI